MSHPNTLLSNIEPDDVFGWPAAGTWEFTTSKPIRSFFPLWLAYGFPLTILKWIWEGLGYGNVPPMVAFYTLRTLMFVLSFVLEDWALHELIAGPRERTRAIALVASSYVTWTFQTHTFSNSIETLLVLWCMVLIKRIRENKASTMASACVGLAFMGVLGTFNRITFPAFLVVPAVQLVPHLFVRTLRIPVLLVAGITTLLIAITVDTEIYTNTRPHLRSLFDSSVITPWNNFVYNSDPKNLAQHGLHPFWQHFGANLPQLIGPALPLVILSSRMNSLFWSAIIGIGTLSCIKHQEARFLLPAVPLLLSSIKIPTKFTRAWVASWIIFNVVLGFLFGFYHQAGIVPAQRFIEKQQNVGQVYWWKTYSPPMWLDGDLRGIKTQDFMGMEEDRAMPTLFNNGVCERDRGKKSLLVVPASATFLDKYVGPDPKTRQGVVRLQELWRYRAHIGLDDLDFGGDGMWPTLKRVIGRRGLVVYQVVKKC